jgi:hypothetical protein
VPSVPFLELVKMGYHVRIICFELCVVGHLTGCKDTLDRLVY